MTVGNFEGCFSLLLSERDRERLRDFLLEDFSLEQLRDSRSVLTLDLLLERDLQVSERDFLLLGGLCDLRVRERDFSGDLEGEFLFDLEWDFRLDLELDRRLLRDRELQKRKKYNKQLPV